ncbi:MAG: RAMP superfamily CRISPR-associated protein [Pseudomonadota bacterium]
MARSVSKRLTISGILRAIQPLHVGGMADSVETDMPLAKNGMGELYIPGTSLAGVFRAWMERFFSNVDVLENFWGSQQHDSASRILVEDAKVFIPDKLSEELWENISVDRRWGVTAEHQKFDYTVLPKGSTFPLCLYLELPPIELANTMRAMLGHLVKALQAGQIRLGAGTSRGLGQIILDAPQLCEVDWHQKASVLNYLSDKLESRELDGNTLIEKAVLPLVCRHPDILHVTIDWAPIGPLMVKTTYDGIAVDTLPFVSGVAADKVALILPGSSLKGALRTQAERIIRTVLNHRNLSRDWSAQLEVPLVEPLFGGAKKAAKKNSRYMPGRGCFSVNTCYAKNAVCSTQQWQEIETAQSPGMINSLYESLNRAGLRDSPFFEQAYHLAVDRWTGGAADGFLYSVIEPFDVQWEPIEISLDLSEDRFPPELQSPALTLLLLLLHDMADRRIAIGFGVNRGYGVVGVKNISFEWEKVGNMAPYHWLDGISLAPPFSLEQLPEIKSLQNDWLSFISRLN